MLQAELHGKVSSRAVTSDDTRLEDTLTSAVFGALQYLPRSKALRAVLNAAFPHLTWGENDCAVATFEFWPTFSDGTEPDLILTVGGRMLVVEAKYGASFGVRQLEREWQGGQQLAEARGHREVLLLAVTPNLGAEPTDVQRFREEKILGLRVAHLSWQQIGLALDEVNLATQEANDLRADVLSLMEKRGVRHVYTGIEEEDWWLVSAAQRIARKRVYPQIAALARELQQTLEQDGIRWGSSEDRIVHYHSFSLSSPASWARSYLQLPLWPADLATEGRGKWWATFQVLFDFLNAEVTVGYLTRPQTVTEARQSWIPAVPGMLDAARNLPHDWVLSTTHGNYANLTRSQHPQDWTEDELRADLSKPQCHLVLERRLGISQFGGGDQARSMVLESVAAIKERPIWLPEQARSTSTASAVGQSPVADDEALEMTEIDAAEDAGTGLIEN